MDRAGAVGVVDSPARNCAGGGRYAMLTVAGFCFWMAALHWLRLPHSATSIGWVALSFYFAFYLPVFRGAYRAWPCTGSACR